MNSPRDLPLVYLPYISAEEGKPRCSVGLVVCGLGFGQVL